MLIINDVTVSYGEKTVLSGLSLSLEEKCVHGLIGLNGSGKTTLLNVLYGLKKRVSGSIEWDGQKMNRKNIAYLEVENFFYSYITGAEYLNLFPQTEGYDMELWNRLFQLPLGDLIESYSTGMKRKLALMGIIKQK